MTSYKYYTLTLSQNDRLKWITWARRFLPLVWVSLSPHRGPQTQQVRRKDKTKRRIDSGEPPAEFNPPPPPKSDDETFGGRRRASTYGYHDYSWEARALFFFLLPIGSNSGLQRCKDGAETKSSHGCKVSMYISLPGCLFSSSTALTNDLSLENSRILLHITARARSSVRYDFSAFGSIKHTLHPGLLRAPSPVTVNQWRSSSTSRQLVSPSRPLNE